MLVAWGCRRLQPKPSVAWRKNTCRGWAVSRIAGFPGRGWGGFIYLFIYLLTFICFSESLVEVGGQEVIGNGKEQH